MSITKDFEKRRYEQPNKPTMFYWDDVGHLLRHTRALEAMLKKHEWAARVGYDGDFGCPECRGEDFMGHSPDCSLAKLLEGLE